MSAARANLFVPTKLDYVRGKRPAVACILCEIVARSDTVDRLEVHRTDRLLVSLNLHPYNPGHLLVFPHRHVTRMDVLTDQEVMEVHKTGLLAMRVLDELYGPHGYTVGWNLGRASGASIEHIHLHLVPRYERELGFMDIIGGAKLIVEDPNKTAIRLRDAFAHSTRIK